MHPGYSSIEGQSLGHDRKAYGGATTAIATCSPSDQRVNTVAAAADARKNSTNRGAMAIGATAASTTCESTDQNVNTVADATTAQRALRTEATMTMAVMKKHAQLRTQRLEMRLSAMVPGRKSSPVVTSCTAPTSTRAPGIVARNIA